MAWIIYGMTSLALLVMGVFTTQMFANRRVRRAAGLAVNTLWLVFAGFAFWSFEAPAAVQLAPDFCATGWVCPRVGAPLEWRNSCYRMPMSVEAQVVKPAVAAAPPAGVPGTDVFGDFGPMALDLFLWMVPVFAFWLLLLLCKPKAQLAPQTPARQTNG